MDIALVHWPEEESRRSQLAARRHPRLLLVAATAAPPACHDLLEDWVRLPVPDEDMRARVRSLQARIDEHLPTVPTVESPGLIRLGAASAALTPLQARLAARLVADFGSVVGRDELIEAGWPESKPSRNNVDAHMARLRRRLDAIEVQLVTVRSRGFMLQGL